MSKSGSISGGEFVDIPHPSGTILTIDGIWLMPHQSTKREKRGFGRHLAKDAFAHHGHDEGAV